MESPKDKGDDLARKLVDTQLLDGLREIDDLVNAEKITVNEGVNRYQRLMLDYFEKSSKLR